MVVVVVATQCSEVSVAWQDMKLGCGPSVVLKMYHDDAETYYDSCTDLRKVITDLRDRNHRIAQGENIKIMQAQPKLQIVPQL